MVFGSNLQGLLHKTVFINNLIPDIEIERGPDIVAMAS